MALACRGISDGREPPGLARTDGTDAFLQPTLSTTACVCLDLAGQRVAHFAEMAPWVAL